MTTSLRLLMADTAYFPTSANWPILNVHAEAFHATLIEHVFCPIHVVDVSDKYVKPTNFVTHLPGMLVKVYFTLHYWNFKLKGKSYNSYSANIQQVHNVSSCVTLQHSNTFVTPELLKAVSDGHAEDSRPSALSEVTVANAPEAIVHVPIMQPGNKPHITHARTSCAPKGFVDVLDVTQAETLGALETMVNVSVEGKQASEVSIKDAKGKRGRV
ncbi:hypothetical protein BDN71DRAFT_1506882 [Pleurotus eryngii]|uniref:Uncharacterized protein n=1 Tax=Pleurotus eryngii TaxID=5323 RepID=A0A9P5ZVN1_PLEER|nr:hypothetical protein BDN71DRAFT_1506882 [Pleurotus eryngii]